MQTSTSLSLSEGQTTLSQTLQAYTIFTVEYLLLITYRDVINSEDGLLDLYTRLLRVRLPRRSPRWGCVPASGFLTESTRRQITRPAFASGAFAATSSLSPSYIQCLAASSIWSFLSLTKAAQSRLGPAVLTRNPWCTIRLSVVETNMIKQSISFISYRRVYRCKKCAISNGYWSILVENIVKS